MHAKNEIFIEHKFDLSQVYPGLYGTADCVIYDAGKKKLHVFDYKHGAGIPVAVENNPQLMYYGLGALLSLNLPIKEVELHIVQPRFDPSNPIKSWVTSPLRIMDFAADLKTFAEAALDPKAKLKSGDHCGFCPAKTICPELGKTANEIARSAFNDEVVKALSPKQMAEFLDKIPLLETWIKGIREHAYVEALHGRVPTGYKLVSKRAMRRWTDPDAAATRLGREINGNVLRECMTDPELKSPAQVEKILGKANAPLIEELTSKISSGDALVKEEDPRPEVKRDAISEFKTDFMQ